MGWFFESQQERQDREAKERAAKRKAKQKAEEKRNDREALAGAVGRIACGLWKAG